MTTQETESNGFGRLDIKTDATGRMIKNPPIPKQKPLKTRHNQPYLDHYLDGSGEPMRIPAEDMVKSDSLNGAMKTNRERFEDSMSKGSVKKKWWGRQDHPFKDQILNMKDGEIKTLDAPNRTDGIDTWDRDIEPGGHFLKLDPRKELGLGHVKVKSKGKFEATRTGDTLQILGNVDHEVKDRYDFSEGFMFGHFKGKETKGEAKSFDIEGKKRDKVDGHIKIKNGEIEDSSFEWDDAD
jgi:hypothetical protein